jgi:regulator of protease activity HflC (stomatin/prohibitin superfamily)
MLDMPRQAEGKGGSMPDALNQLNREHLARQLQRAKARAAIAMLGGAVAFLGIGLGVLLIWATHTVAGGMLIGASVVAAVLWGHSAQLLAEWDRAVVLRLGHFDRVRGPGFFMIVPLVDSITRVVDMRVRTTAFYIDAMLTRDTVPVGLDAIAFWHVWDAKKAVLEVESYYQAIALAVQTALRDIVGLHSLAECLSEREKIAEALQGALQAKAEDWGISVKSIEIRDIAIPEKLKDALSKQAQAERERQALSFLGQAEVDVAQQFVDAARAYGDDPVALQLRTMNILGEGLRAGGTLMLVPSTTLDTMNLGGLAALGLHHGRAAPRAGPSTAAEG